MQLFVITNHCTSRLHCKVCRNADGGRKWRESLSKNFELPQGKIDFECPYGLPWNYGQPIPANGVPKTPQLQPNPSPLGVSEASSSSSGCPTCKERKQPLTAQRVPTRLGNSGTRNVGTGGCGCSRNK